LFLKRDGQLQVTEEGNSLCLEAGILPEDLIEKDK
jgi:hypothetical protein